MIQLKHLSSLTACWSWFIQNNNKMQEIKIKLITEFSKLYEHKYYDIYFAMMSLHWF
jgi:hypothetical protein